MTGAPDELGLTVVDLKKKWFKAYEHYTLQNQLEQLGGATCQAEPPSGQPCRLASVVVGKMCPDHLDRWSKVKGCGPTSHRCCTCVSEGNGRLVIIGFESPHGRGLEERAALVWDSRLSLVG